MNAGKNVGTKEPLHRASATRKKMIVMVPYISAFLHAVLSILKHGHGYTQNLTTVHEREGEEGENHVPPC